VEKTKGREGIKQLGLPLIHQVAAVSIQHEAVTLEHIHDLEKMVRSVSEQGNVSEQARDQLLVIGQRGRGVGHQERPPGRVVRAS